MTRKLTLVAVVAMLTAGATTGLGLPVGSHAADGATAVQETTTAAETANVTFFDQSVNQTDNATAVVVERVVVPEGGFVVIHAATNDTSEMTETEMEGETEMATETEMEGETETAVEDGEAAQSYQAGEVLGNSSYLDPGVHENVTVELDQSLDLEAGDSRVLIAMPHQDTNDNQQYEFPEADDPYTADGQPVTDWANVTQTEPTR